MGAASLEFYQREPGHPAEQWRDLLPLMKSGVIDPPIGAVFALDETAEAIRQMDERRAAGRILVRTRRKRASP